MMFATSHRALLLAGGLALALPLAGCGDKVPEATQQAAGGEISNDTLASELADAGSLGTVSQGLKDTGLAQVFDGSAAYTILAPNDAAFKAIADQNLGAPENKAMLAEVLRDHILPGALSEADIAKAIQTSGKPVEMTTMGDTTVKFSMDGDKLTVTGPDGKTARLAGEPVLATNGAALPIDAVLRTE